MSRLKLTDKDICGMYSRGLNAPEICLYKWLWNKKAIGKRILIHCDDFLEWMKKNTEGGKCISKRHGFRVIRNLGARGFCEIKERSCGFFEIILFSLDFVFGRKTKEATNPPREKPSNPQEDGEAKKSASLQQQLLRIKELCLEVDINYRLPKDWWEIVGHGVEKVEATIEVFKHRLKNSLRNPIYNPPGWFKQALRDNYYLDFDFDYSPPSIVDAYLHLAKSVPRQKK